MSVLFDIVYKNKIRGNSLSTFLKLNFIAPVVLICTRSEVFTNSISDSDHHSHVYANSEGFVRGIFYGLAHATGVHG